MGDRLKDKVAVVTGSGQGIGRAIAVALAQEGTKVMTNNRWAGTSGGDAETTAKQITDMGGQAMPFFGDVSNFETANKLIQTAVDNFGRIDILVNNAGIVRDRMIFNMTPEEWDDVIKVHLYGVFNCTRPAAALMRQQNGGRIISITSGAGLIGNSGQANYGAAKAGIAGFTRVCARDLGKYGITVNAVAPGAATRMTLSEEVLAARKIRAERGIGGVSRQPAAQMQMPEPEDVAPIVVFLVSDVAANINGCIFGAIGGRVDLYATPMPIKSIYKDGRWTLDELLKIMPTTLVAGLVNPAPPAPPPSQ